MIPILTFLQYILYSFLSHVPSFSISSMCMQEGFSRRLVSIFCFFLPVVRFYVVLCSFLLYISSSLSVIYSAKVIREAETELSTGKEAMKLKGIRKGIGQCIDEFRNAGMITKVSRFALSFFI